MLCIVVINNSVSIFQMLDFCNLQLYNGTIVCVPLLFDLMIAISTYLRA